MCFPTNIESPFQSSNAFFCPLLILFAFHLFHRLNPFLFHRRSSSTLTDHTKNYEHSFTEEHTIIPNPFCILKNGWCSEISPYSDSISRINLSVSVFTEAVVSIIEAAYSSKFQLSPVGCHLIQYLCIVKVFRASISISIWLLIPQ